MAKSRKYLANIFPAVYVLLLMLPSAGSAQVTGMSDWNLYIDPGHSRTENMGLYRYSEAEKVLRIGLILRDMLQEQTDIGGIHMARTNDQQLVSLSQRTTHANNTGADFYYSIHSDAGPPHVNSTLMLFGGWRSGGQSVEKTPNGGKLFGDIMHVVLTDAMRIPSRNSPGTGKAWYDRTFYQGFPDNHANKWPYLHVNRETVMASLLSEAGFHTNPTQQMRNVNAEWRRLEAKAAFWTILEFHGLERPEVGILTGFLSDSQSGQLINGAWAIVDGDTVYTTDTYESLFHKYSNDPEEMRNGFYYLDGFEPGSTFDITFGSPDHFDSTITVTLETLDFTFLDVRLESSESPRIVDVQAFTPVSALMPGDPLEFTFSRIPDPDSFDGAVFFTPPVALEMSWKDDFTLVITTDSLDFESEYLLTITDQVVDKFNGNPLDGDFDREPGGDYELQIHTSGPDTDPPVLLFSYPSADEPARELRPVLRLVYDEPVAVGSLSRDAVLLSGPDGNVRGTIQLSFVERMSVLHFFPETDLKNDTGYTVQIQSGLADRFGNKTEAKSFSFVTDAEEIAQRLVIDNFNSGISGWWVPQQSGSTSGIITEVTEREAESRIVNFASGSTGSMRIGYGWEEQAGLHLIRLYLPPGASQNRRFNDNYIVQANIYGDGSGTQFRFMLRDGGNQLEGSPWYTIDWIGWKRVAWDLRNDPVVGWVNGDGILTGQLHTDSFQLSRGADGAAMQGTIYVDDYEIVMLAGEPTGATDELTDLPDTYRLDQNYPNPFNPVTVIGFELPVRSEIRLEVFDMLGRRVSVLADGEMEAGRHQVSWDAVNHSSGVYIYKLQTDGGVVTRKMTLIK